MSQNSPYAASTTLLAALRLSTHVLADLTSWCVKRGEDSSHTKIGTRVVPVTQLVPVIVTVNSEQGLQRESLQNFPKSMRSTFYTSDFANLFVY